MVVLYLSLIVLLPLAARAREVLRRRAQHLLGPGHLAESVAALKLTVIASLIVVAINAVFGTIIAWVLVRDDFPGKAAVNAMIDLPFALPTIVASLTLLTLYGSDSPFGIDIAFTRTAVVVALLFVTLPFVVRAVQPLLIEMDREMEEAATSLGASGFTVFRRIIFPNLLPGLAAGVALAFARALGEFGSRPDLAAASPTRPGLLGLHPQPDRVRQRLRRRRRFGRAAGRLAARCWSASALSSAGAAATNGATAGGFDRDADQRRDLRPRRGLT